MKRCPTCKREYTDDALSFCLDDGGKLESAAPPASQDPQATLMITPEVLRTMQAGAQTTSPTPPAQQTYSPPPPQQTFSPPPTQYSQAGAGWGATAAAPAPKKKSAMPWIIGGLVVLLLGGIGVVVLVVVFAMNADTNNNNNQSANGNNNNRGAASPTPTPTPSVATKKIPSSDGVSTISVPNDWETTTELNTSARIQVKNPGQTMFAIVLTDQSSAAASLEEYAAGNYNRLKSSLTGVRESGPVSATINGEPASVYEVHGKISNGANIGYLLAIVKTADHYHQIYAWTGENTFTTNRATLQSVIESFREE